MNITQKIKEFGSVVSKAINRIFKKEQLDNLARKTGFVQRSNSKIQGSDFIELMTTEIVQEPNISYDGLCDRLKSINLSADITAQALEQRVNTDGAVSYLEETLKLALLENLKLSNECIDVQLLDFFRHVYLQDSTQGCLHEKLASEFKGSGGSASKSSVKIDLVYEWKQHIIYELLVSQGATADQSRAGSFLEQLKPKDLLLRDLGYFKIASKSQIKTIGAFSLSRLHKSVDVYLSKDDEIPLDLPKYLNKAYRNDNVIDITVYLGKKERLQYRLIAYRPPHEIVRYRRSKARQNATKKGKKPPTQGYLDWLEFSFFVTNVPVEIWSAKIVGTIYRLRWQVELIFKNWKSLLQIHILKGTRVERIKCLIYGRLISIVVITIICGFASKIAQLQYQQEVSFHKVIQWLLRSERLANAVCDNLISSLLVDLGLNLQRLCKQKRKRKTTQELINSQIDYMESFDHNTIRQELIDSQISLNDNKSVVEGA